MTGDDESSLASELDYILSLTPQQMGLLSQLVTVAVASLSAHESFDSFAVRLRQCGKLACQPKNIRRDFRHNGSGFIGQVEQVVCAAL